MKRQYAAGYIKSNYWFLITTTPSSILCQVLQISISLAFGHGKDLLGEVYQRITKMLSDKKIYADIRYQVQAIEKQTGEREAARNLFFRYDKSEQDSSDQLTGMLYGFLLELKSWENNGVGYGFPFDRLREIMPIAMPGWKLC